jgi:succinate dehydrogenase flavin-adding protein (antitoxin of CptAB toxin-antitoxin module)
MSVLEEQIKMWEENSNKSFAKILTQIDNEFRKVIAPTKDEFGFEYTPISVLKSRWVMGENVDDKMIEYVGRLLMVLSDYDFISIKSNRLIIEDEQLKSLITKIRKISSFKKEHLEETVRFYNL